MHLRLRVLPLEAGSRFLQDRRLDLPKLHRRRTYKWQRICLLRITLTEFVGQGPRRKLHNRYQLSAVQAFTVCDVGLQL
jgi:hypothetical protein